MTQTETTPRIRTTAAMTWMPCRVQNRRLSATAPPSSLRARPIATRRTNSTSSTNATVNNTLTPLVRLIPTSVTPKS
jgi:hypothetical protein